MNYYWNGEEYKIERRWVSRVISAVNMLQRRGSKLCIVLAIVLGVAGKPPPPPGAPWASYVGKPVYSRALGPPASGMGTISVPYMPKSPMFPKFVDPKAMISKKTDFLSNLFGGIGPVDNSGSVGNYPTLGATDTSGKIQSTISENTVPYKRGLFGPMVSPFASMGPMSPMGPMGPMGGMYNPMASKFGMMGPKFPFGGLGSPMDPDSYESPDSSSRRRRSVASLTSDGMENFFKSLAPEPTKESFSTKDTTPPPYPGLEPIAEEPESSDSKTPLLKLFGPPASAGFMPGMINPFSPTVDPGMLISKKAAFLDALFKNLATTTPSPVTTEAPVPKSTIVPPNFWLPTSVIPGPTEYSQKVSDFLGKLFDSLALNMTLNATTPEDSEAASTKIARSVDDFTTISAAKDAIVDSILSELGVIKGSLVSTLNDLIAYEKTAAASPIPKKPFKPFAPGFWPGSTVDATLPFQQRVNVLSQVFDMLTDLQRNITTAVQESIKAKAASEESDAMYDFSPVGGYPYFSEATPAVLNTTLLDSIRSKLASLPVPGSPGVTSSKVSFAPKFARMAPKAPSSVWVSYPPSAASSKREVSDFEDYPSSDNHSDRNQVARAVNMQMRQGYQSMPPGTIETVQAGGGSVPGHQGGGIKLLDSQSNDIGSKWAEWGDYVKNQYQGQRHHHNHH